MVRFLSSFRISQKLGFPALNSTDGSRSSWKTKVPRSCLDIKWEEKVEEIGQWTVSDQSAWLIQLSLKLLCLRKNFASQPGSYVILAQYSNSTPVLFWNTQT